MWDLFAYVRNHTHLKVFDEIAYQFLKFNSRLEMDK